MIARRLSSLPVSSIAQAHGCAIVHADAFRAGNAQSARVSVRRHEEHRLHHHRRRLGRLHARGAADRGCGRKRAAARSRRLGPQSVDQAALRLGQGAARPHLQLELRDRAGAGARQPPRRMRARQGDRRLVLDQRDGLCARPSRRLRPLGRRLACRAGPMRTCFLTSGGRRRWEGGADAYRGGDGPLTVETSRYQDPLVDAYLEAGRDAGHPATADYNGARAARLRAHPDDDP